MKVKARIELREFKIAHLTVNDQDFLNYVNQNNVAKYGTVEKLLAEEDGDWWLREYLEERTFKSGSPLVNVGLEPAGETQYFIDDTEVLDV